MIGWGGIRQLGFVTGDAKGAAERWLANSSAGPFFLIRGARFADWHFEGKSQDLVLDISFAQCGEVMLEFIQPIGEWPNVYGATPLAADVIQPHHHGYLVDNVESAEKSLGGITPLTRARINDHAELRYYDLRSTLGTFVEFIQDCDETRGFFDLSKHASLDWKNREEPLRSIEFEAA